MSDKNLWEAIDRVTEIMSKLDFDAKVERSLATGLDVGGWFFNTSPYHQRLYKFYTDNKDQCKDLYFSLKAPIMYDTSELWFNFKGEQFHPIRVGLRYFDHDDPKGPRRLEQPEFFCEYDKSHTSSSGEKIPLTYSDDQHQKLFSFIPVDIWTLGPIHEYEMSLKLVLRINRQSEIWLLFKISIDDEWKFYVKVKKIEKLQDILDEFPNQVEFEKKLIDYMKQHIETFATRSPWHEWDYGILCTAYNHRGDPPSVKGKPTSRKGRNYIYDLEKKSGSYYEWA